MYLLWPQAQQDADLWRIHILINIAEVKIVHVDVIVLSDILTRVSDNLCIFQNWFARFDSGGCHFVARGMFWFGVIPS